MSCTAFKYFHGPIYQIFVKIVTSTLHFQIISDETDLPHPLFTYSYYIQTFLNHLPQRNIPYHHNMPTIHLHYNQKMG